MASSPAVMDPLRAKPAPSSRRAPLPELVALPDRIWVMGPTGSGKTTLAGRLAADLGIAATHMDDIHWRPGWVESPREETLARVSEIAAGPRWVIEGGYTFVRDQLLDRVQLFVWLDLPLRVTFPRLVRRGLSRSWHGTLCCNGNTETLARTFLHRDSLLLWAVTHFKETRQKAAHTAATRPHIRLRSPGAVAAWMAEWATRRERESATEGGDATARAR